MKALNLKSSPTSSSSILPLRPWFTVYLKGLSSLFPYTECVHQFVMWLNGQMEIFILILFFYAHNATINRNPGVVIFHG